MGPGTLLSSLMILDKAEDSVSLPAERRQSWDLSPKVVEGLHNLLHIKHFAPSLALPKYYYCY